MPNGDIIVGLFNREDTKHLRSINFKDDLGLIQGFNVRDLLLHENLGAKKNVSDSIEAHGCRILKILVSDGPQEVALMETPKVKKTFKVFSFSSNSGSLKIIYNPDNHYFNNVATSIFNMYGNKIFQSSINKIETVINPNLKSVFYLVVLIQNNLESIQKLIDNI